MDLNLVQACNETPAIVSGRLARSTPRDGFRGRSTHPTRYIESIRSGRVKYLKVERFDTLSQVYGDTVITTGRARIDVKVSDIERNLNMRYANVWIKTPQGWQFALWQSTPIPKT